jgi:hypothetical protein
VDGYLILDEKLDILRFDDWILPTAYYLLLLETGFWILDFYA